MAEQRPGRPSKTPATELGQRLRVAREKSGYDIEYCAKAIDVSYDWWSGLERGDTEWPRVDLLLKAAELIDSDPYFLCFGRQRGKK